MYSIEGNGLIDQQDQGGMAETCLAWLPDGSTITYSAVRKMVSKAPVTNQSAEAELDQKVRSLMRSTGRTYSEAMSVVLNLDSELKARWIKQTLTNKAVPE